MQENKRSSKQNEKVKDNVVQASRINVDEKNNSKQASKVETEVQDKKKTAILVAIIATILVIAILGMTAYARYRSKIEGQGTALVAAWSFKVNGSEEAIASFDLGTTRSDANGKVADGVIAPGISGSFDIEIDGSGSEVAIDYIIEMDVSAKPTNLKFYRNSDFTDEIIIGENSILNIQGYIDLEKVNTKVREKIYWNWPYRTGETEDEKLVNDKIDSQEMGKTIEMPIKVIGIQSNASSNNLLQSTIEVISPSSGTYKQGQEIIVQVNYNNNIYGGTDKVAINESSAPVMKIRLGNGEEKQASYRASKENYIQYAYTIEDYDYGSLIIVSYIGNVYNENGEKLEVKTKELSGNSIVADCRKTLADVVSVGDYVNYNANDNGSYSYTTNSTLTGSTAESTFSSSDTMKWRVLSVDKTSGAVELMSADTTANTVTLSGKIGFKNAETVLNDIGAVYGHGKGAVSGRSIKVEDVEQYSSYDKTTYTDGSYKYGNKQSYTSGTFFKEIQDSTGKVIGYETEETIASTSNPVTMTSTAYKTTDELTTKTYFTDTIYKMLFKNSAESSNKNYFLASRNTANITDYCNYHTVIVWDGWIDMHWNFSSNGAVLNPNAAAVPVVMLKSNIYTNGKDSTRSMEINCRIKIT